MPKTSLCAQLDGASTTASNATTLTTAQTEVMKETARIHHVRFECLTLYQVFISEIHVPSISDDLHVPLLELWNRPNPFHGRMAVAWKTLKSGFSLFALLWADISSFVVELFMLYLVVLTILDHVCCLARDNISLMQSALDVCPVSTHLPVRHTGESVANGWNYDYEILTYNSKLKFHPEILTDSP